MSRLYGFSPEYILRTDFRLILIYNKEARRILYGGEEEEPDSGSAFGKLASSGG